MDTSGRITGTPTVAGIFLPHGDDHRRTGPRTAVKLPDNHHVAHVSWGWGARRLRAAWWGSITIATYSS